MKRLGNEPPQHLRTRILTLALLLGAGAVWVASACVLDSIDLERPGFPCNPDGSCRNGLVCEDGVCVRPPDAGSGTADGGPSDGGRRDAGRSDGGHPDAGAPDGGPGDGGPPDGGGNDGGPTVDGGPTCEPSGAMACRGCADGTPCTQASGGGVCLGQTCFDGCWVGGEAIPTGTTEPGNPCRVCDPRVSATAFTDLLDGTACTDDGNPCTADQCQMGACTHEAVQDDTPCPPDTNPCTEDLCRAGTCTHPPAAAGTACGASGQCDGSGNCSEGCDIGGTFYAAGTVDPNEPCRLCDPTQDAQGWTPRPDGTDCDDGDLCNGIYACQSGACVETSPAETCGTPPACHDAAGATCDPVTGTCTYPQSPDGTVCGPDSVCLAGSCQAGCYLSGAFYPSGTAHPSNPCLECDPLRSTTDWSSLADGTDCDDGDLCNGVATCQGGTCMASAGVVCEAPPTCRTAQGATCDPGTGECSYPPSPDGTSCGLGAVCVAGSCQAGCYISGIFYPPGASNPGDPCLACDPGQSTSAWSPSPDGTTCSVGFCVGGSCTPGDCYINGAVYASGQSDPTEECRYCHPSLSTTSWTTQADNTTCGSWDMGCCSGSCVSLGSNVNCGWCGNRCAFNEECLNGTCQPRGG
ncbi:MAG: hypothetical protein D6729_15730 [Deltaproteobacteria bacterium]|nr:MAG: hypothetical protein D6729_15730 [Deltaproteobacteria bacterium]